MGWRAARMPSIPDQSLFAHVRKPKPKHAWRRLLDFVEQPLFLASVGIIGGIAGILFAIPVLLVCDGCLLLALHRSRMVADKSRAFQLFVYVAFSVVMAAILVWIGNLVKQNARAFATEVAVQVASMIKTSAPIPNATKPDTTCQQLPDRPPRQTPSHAHS